MVDVGKYEAMKLLQDENFVKEVISKVVENPEVLDELAEDVADELAEIIEDDPTIRKKIIDAAITNPDFKKRIVKELIDELGD